MDNKAVYQGNNNKFFSLLNNPFFLLKSSPEENIETLTDNYEDLLYEGDINEQILTKIYQSVCTSLSRLTAEISWLLGISKNEVFTSLTNTESKMGESWSKIAQINFLANQFTNSSNNELLTQWLNNWTLLSVEETLELVNSQRQISNFPKINLDQLKAAINQLRSQQVSTLIYDIASYEKHHKWLLEQLQKEIDQPLLTGSLLAELVTTAESVTTAKLETIKEQILSIVDELFSTSEQEQSPVLVKLEQTMQCWQSFAQTSDLARKRRGLQSQGKTLTLFSDLTNKLFAKTSEQFESIYNLNLAISIFNLFEKYIINHEDLREDKERIVNSYIVDRNILLLKDKLPNLLDLYSQAKQDLDSFFSQVSAGHFSLDSTANCLATYFYKELQQQLANNQDATTRDAIYSMIQGLFLLGDNDAIHHIYGLIPFITSLKQLAKNYPYEQNDSFKKFQELLELCETVRVNNYMKIVAQQQNIAELSNFIKYALTHIVDNDLLVKDLKDMQVSVNDVRKQETSNSIGSILTVIIIVVVIFINLAQCAR